MVELAEHERERWSALAPEGRGRTPRGGIAASLALHAAVILALVFELPGLKQEPSPEQLVPVNLVRLGNATAAATAATPAVVPQEKAEETAQQPDAKAVPVPETPPPPTAARPAPEKSPPPVLDAAKPQPRPALTKPNTTARSDATAAAKLQHPPAPADELATRLAMLARLKQPPAPQPPSPRLQEGSGISNIDAASANAARGRDASYGVKDAIRAQVERHWNLDRSAVKGADWSVSIRMSIDERGRIESAEIVDDPRHDGDDAYREFALSARNAVLLSSPLLLPPGSYDIAKDIVVDFDSRLVSR